METGTVCVDTASCRRIAGSPRPRAGRSWLARMRLERQQRGDVRRGANSDMRRADPGDQRSSVGSGLLWAIGGDPGGASAAVTSRWTVGVRHGRHASPILHRTTTASPVHVSTFSQISGLARDSARRLPLVARQVRREDRMDKDHGDDQSDAEPPVKRTHEAQASLHGEVGQVRSRIQSDTSIGVLVCRPGDTQLNSPYTLPRNHIVLARFRCLERPRNSATNFGDRTLDSGRGVVPGRKGGAPCLKESLTGRTASGTGDAARQ